MFGVDFIILQHYVIMGQVGDFLQALQFSSPIKTDLHDITEILLKVLINIITLTPFKLMILRHSSLSLWFFQYIIFKPMCLVIVLKACLLIISLAMSL